MKITRAESTVGADRADITAIRAILRDAGPAAELGRSRFQLTKRPGQSLAPGRP
jgi:hypothetical protein